MCVCVSTCVCLCAYDGVERVAEVATYVSVLVPEEMALFRAKLELCRAKQRQRAQEPGERRGRAPRGLCAPPPGQALLEAQLRSSLGPVRVPC